jgi:hypothetical protein
VDGGDVVDVSEVQTYILPLEGSVGLDVSGFLCRYNDASETSEICRVHLASKGVGVGGFLYVLSRVGGHA